MQKLTNWMMILVVISAGAGRVAHAAISYSYFYDDLDRLTKVTDSTGVAIDYAYDEVGNHLAVNRTILAPFTMMGWASICRSRRSRWNDSYYSDSDWESNRRRHRSWLDCYRWWTAAMGYANYSFGTD